MSTKTFGNYQISGLSLGEGTYGTVEEAIHLPTNRRCALKIARPNQRHVSSLLKEASILSRVRHPNIITMLEPDIIHGPKNELCIALELATGGEMFDYIANSGCGGICECGCDSMCFSDRCSCKHCGCRRLNDDSARHYLLQLLSGVHYLHTHGVAHLDLKPENLLLDDHDDLKICDFGLSQLVDATTLLRPVRMHNPTAYIAPEILAAKPYDGRAADIWSLGVIAYVMLVGRFPFLKALSIDKHFVKFIGGHFEYPSHLTKPQVQFLKRIFVLDPKQRPSAQELMEDPWLVRGSLNSMTVSLDLSVNNREAATTSPTTSSPPQAPTTTKEAQERLQSLVNAFRFSPEERFPAVSPTPKFATDVTPFSLLATPPAFQDNVKCATRFTTTIEPAKEIIANLQSVLSELNIRNQRDNIWKLRCQCVKSATEVITFTVQLFIVEQGVYIVEFRRGQAEYYHWIDLYKEIRNKCTYMVKADWRRPPVRPQPQQPSTSTASQNSNSETHLLRSASV